MAATTTDQLGPHTPDDIARYYEHGDWQERVLAAVKGPAAATRVRGWQVRDLAPDVVRIELSGLRPRDETLLLGSMARAAADVHATDRGAWKAARTQARDLRRKDFRGLVATMAEAVRADFRAYGD